MPSGYARAWDGRNTRAGLDPAPRAYYPPPRTMNPNRLFLSHEALESWVGAERARIEADLLTDTETGGVFELREGVRFLAEVTGGGDVHHLVGTVKDSDQLAALGGEQMADSVILGDSAYEVQAGFVGRPVFVHDPSRDPARESTRDTARDAAPLNPVAMAPTERPPSPVPAAPPAPKDDKAQRQTIMSLQNFFLNNVK